MQLIINGKPEEIDGPATVTELLASLQLGRQRIAVELNEELVSREAFDSTTFREGDRIEIVTFVGGG